MIIIIIITYSEPSNFPLHLNHKMKIMGTFRRERAIIPDQISDASLYALLAELVTDITAF